MWIHADPDPIPQPCLRETLPQFLGLAKNTVEASRQYRHIQYNNTITMGEHVRVHTDIHYTVGWVTFSEFEITVCGSCKN